MGKQIIDLIGEIVQISGNSTIDSIIFAVSGVISFLVAFGIVGWIFDAIGRYDSDLMSDTHWLIRVLVFIALTWGGVKIAQAIKWLFSFQWWVYVIAGFVFVGIINLIASGSTVTRIGNVGVKMRPSIPQRAPSTLSICISVVRNGSISS